MSVAPTNYLVQDQALWDSQVARSPWGHFLQSWRWGLFKEEGGWQAERFSIAGDAKAQVLWRHTPLGQWGYIPRGPAADLAGPACAELWKAIHQAARARGAAFLRVEPNTPDADPIIAQGFRAGVPCLQPQASLIIDLQPGMSAAGARMKPKTRYNIGLARRRGVVVRRGGSDDLPQFFALLRATAQRDRFYIRPFAYYRQFLEAFADHAVLLLAEHDGLLLGGIVVVAFGAEATYLYGASSNERRNLMAPYLLQWEGMAWAVARGCQRYDLWGIPPESISEQGEVEATDGPPIGEAGRGDMWGVYRFKRGFGGEAVRYAGAFDYVYAPLRYLLWQRFVPLAQRLLALRADAAREALD